MTKFTTCSFDLQLFSRSKNYQFIVGLLVHSPPPKKNPIDINNGTNMVNEPWYPKKEFKSFLLITQQRDHQQWDLSHNFFFYDLVEEH